VLKIAQKTFNFLLLNLADIFMLTKNNFCHLVE